MTKQNSSSPKEPNDDKFLGITMPKKFLGIKLPGRTREFPVLVWGAYLIFAVVAAIWLVFFIIPKTVSFFS